VTKRVPLSEGAKLISLFEHIPSGTLKEQMWGFAEFLRGFQHFQHSFPFMLNNGENGDEPTALTSSIGLMEFVDLVYSERSLDLNQAELKVVDPCRVSLQWPDSSLIEIAVTARPVHPETIRIF
jgi:hypothetical protein